jgi:HEAT repeat protein
VKEDRDRTSTPRRAWRGLPLLIAWAFLAPPRSAPAEPVSIDDLITALGDEQPPVRARAMEELRKVPDQAVPKLIARLKPGDPSFSGAVEFLGSVGTPEAIQALDTTHQALTDRQALNAFLEGLSRATHPKVIPLHLKVLKEDDAPAHPFAWAGLVRFPAKELLPYRAEILPLIDEGLKNVKQAPDIIRVVGRIGHDSGIDFFVLFVRSPVREIHDALRQALWNTDKDVKARFQAILHDERQPRDNRLEAYCVLAHIRDPKLEDMMAGQKLQDDMSIEWLEERKAIEEPEVVEKRLGELICVSPEFWMRVVTESGWAKSHRIFAIKRLDLLQFNKEVLPPAVRDGVAQRARDTKEDPEIRAQALAVATHVPDDLGRTLLFEAAQWDLPQAQRTLSRQLPELPPTKELLAAYTSLLKISKDFLVRRRVLIGLVDMKDDAANQVVLDWLETEDGRKEFWLAPYLRSEIKRQKEEDED